MFYYKIDVMKALKNKGYTANFLRRKKILSENTMQSLRHGESITLKSINTICILLDCQPSDIIEITPTQEEKNKLL